MTLHPYHGWRWAETYPIGIIEIEDTGDMLESPDVDVVQQRGHSFDVYVYGDEANDPATLYVLWYADTNHREEWHNSRRPTEPAVRLQVLDMTTDSTPVEVDVTTRQLAALGYPTVSSKNAKSVVNAVLDNVR